MSFKIYRFELQYRYFPVKHGLLIESREGRWSEVSPLPGRNQETLEEAHQQLQALQRGWRGALLPSVAFGMYGLTAPPIASAPCALLLCGTPEEVLSTASQPHGCRVAKLKVGHWTIDQALEVILILTSQFDLRIDFNGGLDKGGDR